MKKRVPRRLQLSRETIHLLEAVEISNAVGASFSCLRSCYAACNTDEMTMCREGCEPY
jgi:hypothetical protein